MHGGCAGAWRSEQQLPAGVNDSFSHGQTYVAFGRACNRDSVCVLIRPDRIHSTGDRVNALVRNVVYPALLQ